LSDFAVKAFNEGNDEYLGEVAAKLRLLTSTRGRNNKPLLLGLAQVFKEDLFVQLTGPAIPIAPNSRTCSTREEALVARSNSSFRSRARPGRTISTTCVGTAPASSFRSIPCHASRGLRGSTSSVTERSVLALSADAGDGDAPGGTAGDLVDISSILGMDG
jgi:hypothetical protein